MQSTHHIGHIRIVVLADTLIRRHANWPTDLSNLNEPYLEKKVHKKDARLD